MTYAPQLQPPPAPEPPRGDGVMDAGFYPEPGNPQLCRYWDGSQWTPETRQADQPGAVPTQSPAKRRPTAAIISAAVVVVLGVGFAIFWFLIRTPTMSIRGTMDIQGTAGDNYSVSAPDKIGNTSCSGSGGYDDITEGAEVTITDSGNKTLAVGHLEAGIYIDGTGACIFGFQVDAVPSDQKFYGVVVTHRGNVQFSKAQMKRGPDVTIGS